MEITEKERLMLVKKKEEICGLTFQIIELANDPKNAVELKKDITMVLSLLSTIASYAETRNYKFNGFREIADTIFRELTQPVIYSEEINKYDSVLWHNDIKFQIELFCNYANSVTFDFTKKGLKINIPKIDISIFRMK